MNRPMRGDKAYLYYIRDGKLQEIEGSVQTPIPYHQKKIWFKWHEEINTDIPDYDVTTMRTYKLRELRVAAEENVVFNENVWYREPNKNQAAVALAAYYMGRKNDALRKIEAYDEKLDICITNKEKGDH